MAIRYHAYLQMGADTSLSIPLDTFEITEAYNAGWNGFGVVTARSEEEPISLGSMFFAVAGINVLPGDPGTVLLTYVSQSDEGDDTGTGGGDGGDGGTGGGDGGTGGTGGGGAVSADVSYGAGGSAAAGAGTDEGGGG